MSFYAKECRSTFLSSLMSAYQANPKMWIASIILMLTSTNMLCKENVIDFVMAHTAFLNCPAKFGHK